MIKTLMKPITAPADEPEYHSPIGWSGWDRHSNCHGSVALAEFFGLKSETSSAAALGTLAHGMARLWLLSGDRPSGMDAEMENFIRHYVYTVWNTLPKNTTGSLWMVESRVAAPSIHKDCSGTVDALVWNAVEKVLSVHDLKYGKFPVDARENVQLMGYAMCALETWPQVKPERIDLYIHQVRLDPKPDMWSCDPLDIDIFRDEVIEHVAAIEQQKKILKKTKDPKKLDLHAGDHCKYCPAWSTCDERKNAAKRDGIELLMPKPAELPKNAGDVVAFALKALPWAKMVLKNARAYMQKGGSIPGLKLVAGKRARVPIDPESFVDELTADPELGGLGLRPDAVMTAPEPKLKTIKQLEEVMTKEQKDAFKNMWKFQDGAPALVLESDKRPALKPKAEDYFKALPEGEDDEDDETE